MTIRPERAGSYIHRATIELAVLRGLLNKRLVDLEIGAILRQIDAVKALLIADLKDVAQQQPVQARDWHGALLWQHPCGSVYSVSTTPMAPGPCADCAEKHLPWRPLLVGGARVPEVTEAQYAEQFQRIAEAEAPILASELAEQQQWTPGAGWERLKREAPDLVPELTDEDMRRADAIIAAADRRPSKTS
jgi:hypothetical protein